MGCVVSIIRSVAALIFGVVVFFGFLFLLLLTNFSDKLLSAEFYIDTISGQDTYNRIYEEVLLDEELERTTQDLLGGVQVVSQVEIVGLLREIIPPEYLQSQVKDSIYRIVDYFDDDREKLDLYIDIGPPLNNVKPVLFRYIDQRIDALTEEDLGRLECTPQRVDEVAVLYQDRWDRLSTGVVPTSIPSLATFESGCRLIIFELAFDNLVAQADLDERTKQGLRSRRSDLQQRFVAGESKEVLKVAARPLAQPIMDDSIQQILEEVDYQGQLDLIHRIAVWNDDFAEEELRADIDTTWDWINSGRKFGKPVALLMLILGSIFLGLIHFPNFKNVLRWPGLTLFLTGLVLFITGKVLESQIPDRLQDLVERSANQVTGVPTSVTVLGGDLLVSFGQQLTSGFAGPSLTVLIIGALLFGASFFINYLIFLMRLIAWPLRMVFGQFRSHRPRNDPPTSSEIRS